MKIIKITGTGYHIEIKVQDIDGLENEAGESRDPIQDFMRENFPNAILLEQHASKYHFELPDEDEGDVSSYHHLPFIFAKLQDHKEDLNIEDYSVSQAHPRTNFLEINERGNKRR